MSSTALTQPALPGFKTDHLGLLAGEGQFPLLMAKAASARGFKISAVGLKGLTSDKLADHVSSITWVDFGEFDAVIRALKEAGVQQALMAGRVDHRSIFQISRLDARGMRLIAKLASKKADSVLGVVADELALEGIELLDSTALLKDFMPQPGLLTPNVTLSNALLEGIRFGIEHANYIAAKDIGQSVTVKEGVVVGLEGLEGTDGLIDRSGELAGAGIILAKVAKPSQDLRFDVPVVGLTTIRHLVEAKAIALGFPRDEVLFFDQPEAIALAEENNLCIYAL